MKNLNTLRVIVIVQTLLILLISVGYQKLLVRSMQQRQQVLDDFNVLHNAFNEMQAANAKNQKTAMDCVSALRKANGQ